jgi:hypothetical protein
MVKYKFSFRRQPSVFKFFQMTDERELDKHIRLVDIIKELKFGGYKIGNVFASFWFGVLLFGLQSYFLRQNLQRNTQFISD